MRNPKNCGELVRPQASLAKLQDKYRYHMLLTGPDVDRLRAAARTATENLKSPDDVRWGIDVDPLDML